MTLAGNGSGGAVLSGAVGDGGGGGNLALAVNMPNAVVALSGSNTFSGGTTLSSGTVTAGGNSPLGTGTVTINPSSGTAVLALTGAAPLIGSLSSNGGGASLVLLGNAGGGGSATTLTVGTNNASATFAGAIGDLSLANSAARGSLVKTGTGMQILAGNSTFTAGTTVSAGTLVAAADIALGTGAVTMNPSSGTAVLAFTSATPVIGSLGNSGAGASILSLGDPIAGSPTTLTLGGNNASTTFSGKIIDLTPANFAAIGALVKNGSGNLTLTASNAYTGTTTVMGGTLSISSDSNLGTAPVIYNQSAITLNNATLQIAATTLYDTPTISDNRGITLNNSATISVPVLSSGTFGTAGSERSTQYRGVISGSGNLTITGGTGANSGAAPYILEFGGSNTYTGNTTVSNAIVTAENRAAPNNVGPVNILPATTVLNLINNGWFNMSNGSAAQTLAGLTGDPTGIVSTTNGGNPSNLTINPAVGQSYNFPGVIGAQTILAKTGSNVRITLTISVPAGRSSRDPTLT